MQLGNRETKKGYLLIELMVAITLLTIGFLGFLGLIAQAVSVNRVVSDQFIGNYLAMEGIEIVKNIIDANVNRGLEWNRGLGNGDYEVDYISDVLSSYLNRQILIDTNSGRYSYSFGNPTPFKRKITILNSADSSNIKVDSLVEWPNRGGGFASVNLEDYFFNYK